MFYNAIAFNQDITRSGTGPGSQWDTSKVTIMSHMFKNANIFNVMN